MVESNALAAMMTPKFDAETFATVQQRNLEAFNALSACLAAGAQSLIKRQSELVQTHLSNQLAAATDMFKNSSSQAGLTQQLAFAQAQAKKALADTEELAGIVSATATDALDILYKTTQESMSELYSNGHGSNGNGSVQRTPLRAAPKAG
jgi:phasin family protein